MCDALPSESWSFITTAAATMQQAGMQLAGECRAVRLRHGRRVHGRGRRERLCIDLIQQAAHLAVPS
ncbi:hypothetical protein QFW77_02690 [Luteimonas sp. RD2P54]|uniref:Uncharacterized protein n=1 Tax=Luteimonas endophytica TaxID=3042023 RepID=A0ABT6J5T4_9GAMM|nr:hypothetical protein [Luteimonas endophytica]MDH5821902.1 hypothetical protein [Luteimonas endophytica]